LKTVLYLDKETTDYEPHGSIEKVLGFKVAGKPVIQHLIDLLVDSGVDGSVLVTTNSEMNAESEKIIDSTFKDIKHLPVDFVPITSLYALIQDVEQVLVIDGLVYPTKDDLHSLLERGKQQQLPAVLSSDGRKNEQLFLLGNEPNPATIDFSGVESGTKLSKVIIDHLGAQSISPVKVASTSPVLIVEHSWQLLDLQEMLMKNQSDNDNIIEGEVEPGATLKGKGIVIRSGATIRSGSYIIGPVIIGEGAVIGPNCYIRPSTFIDKKVVIGNAVEVKNSIISEGTHVGHLSYVGDSIIGEKCNFGAGTKVANLKFDNKAVSVTSKSDGTKKVTTRRKLGILMGNKVKTGINASLMPGIKIGEGSVIGAGFLLQTDLENDHAIYLNENYKVIKKKRKPI